MATEFALIPENETYFKSDGTLASGYQLFVYEAGSAVKATTHTESDGLTANSNPIILDSLGQTPSGVYCASGTYKTVLATDTDTDPPATPVRTRDNITPRNDLASTGLSEWVTGPTPTFTSTTTFTLAGDQTSTFHVGRRLKLVDGGGTDYGTILISAYTSLTTITVRLDGSASVLDSGLSSVFYSILSKVNTAVPSPQIVNVKDDFGATGLPGTDDSAAIQAAIDYVKGTYDTTLGEFTAKLDFGGQNYRVESPIDATLIRQPGFTMRNGGLTGVMSGGIVLDMSGTNSPILESFRVYGDKTSVPDIGILQARALISGSYSAAGSHKWFNVHVTGFFNKAAVVNFASEVSSYYGCRFTNRSRSLTAYAFANVDNAKVLTDFVGEVTSTFVTLDTTDDTKSNICHYHAQAHIQRPADVNLTITGISKHATAPVVTLDSGELTAAALSNGDKIWIYSLSGSHADWDALKYKVYTVQNINNGAGTFELASTDTSAFTGTFTSGTFQNQTGPALLLGGSIAMKIEDGSYLLSYGSPTIRVSTDYSGSFNENEFSFQAEHSPPSVMEFDRAGASGYSVQKLKLELLNSAQVNVDEVVTYAGGGTGQINLNSFELDITNMGTAPTNGVFSDATLFRLFNARIHIPLAAAMNTITDFVGFSGEIYSADDNTRTIYDVGTINIEKAALDEPFIDFDATVGSGTTNAISNLQTPSGTVRHLQISVKGVKYWIRAWPTIS